MNVLVVILLLTLGTACSSNPISRSVAGNNLAIMAADYLLTAYRNGEFDRQVYVVIEIERHEQRCELPSWLCVSDNIERVHKPGISKEYPRLIAESNLPEVEKAKALADHYRILNEK